MKKSKQRFSKEFREWMENRKYAESSIIKYCYWYCLFYRETISGEINNKTIEAFIGKHNNVGARAFIKALLKFNKLRAVDFEFPEIRGRKKKRQLTSKVLNDQDIDFIIQKMRSLKYQLIIWLMYEGGLRVSEVINIRVRDIDLEKNSISIIGKGNKERYIRFSEDTKCYLKMHIKNMTKEEKLFTRCSRQAVWQQLNKLKEYMRGGKLFPHMLRHSCASKMIKNKVSIRIIRDYLGHESLATTEIYTHLDTQQINDAWEETFES